MFLDNKRILVTGGNGFVGKHVLSELRAHGYTDVVAPSHSEYDLRSNTQVITMFREFNPEVVIHLAANVGGIGANMKRPGEFFYDNLKMGMELMHVSCNFGVKKFVQIGTVCSYPKFTNVPFVEEDLWKGFPEETNAPYGVSKKALLTMAQAYRQQYDFNAIYLLPTNLYGPGDNFDLETSHVIPALIRKFAEAVIFDKKEVRLWGTGQASREFLYVEDAAKAIVRATEYYDSGEPINLGNGEEIPIFALAGVIAEKVGYKGSIIFDSSKPDGQPRRMLDTTKAFKEFGWKATTNTLDGIDKTIEWYVSECEK